MNKNQHKHIVLNQEDVLRKLTWQNEYAFACWQLPNQTDIQLIVALEKPERHQFSLKDSPTGFLSNTFNESHPISPWFIPADITIDKTGKVTIDDEVPSHSVDSFLDHLDKIENPAFNKEANKQEEGMNKEDFVHFVDKIINELKNGKSSKIVPSRFHDQALKSSFDFKNIFQNICSVYPTSFCNIWSLGNKEIWMGATPESLLSFEDRIFSTVSLAGTHVLKENEKTANVGWTQKEIEEQAIVSRYIINCFKKLRIRDFQEYGPKTIEAGSLAHLCTTFKVDLSEVAFDGLPDQMLELLHPTSAVCGMPRVETAQFLKDHEGYDRSFYSGFIGPVNFEKATKLFVNLRCMRITHNIARFYAGAGVTEDSVSEKEFIETEMKMEVMKRLVN